MRATGFSLIHLICELWYLCTEVSAMILSYVSSPFQSLCWSSRFCLDMHSHNRKEQKRNFVPLSLKTSTQKGHMSILLTFYWPKQVTWPRLIMQRVGWGKGMCNPLTGGRSSKQLEIISPTTLTVVFPVPVNHDWHIIGAQKKTFDEWMLSKKRIKKAS